jgi:glycosyltransferase involved in cell wall biosynthesis
MIRAGQPRRLAIISDAISPYHKGGKEKRIQALSTHLAQRGIDVHIYTMNWWNGERTTRTPEGITLHAISRRRSLYTRSGRRSIWQGVTYALSCLKLIREDFDVVEVDHMPFLPLFSVKLVCLIKRQPMYATWHEVWGLSTWKKYLGPLGYVAAGIERLSVMLPNHIIAVSPQTAQELREKLGYKGPITIATNGIDLQEIDRIPAAGRPVDLTYVGRLIAHKNLDLLIQAMAMLKPTHPNLSLRIIGAGPEAGNLKQLAAQLGLQSSVIFTGRVETDEEMYALLKSAKVFVSPSAREGFGITIIEANACGLPVVTVNLPGNAGRHLVTPGNGAVCEATVQSLALAIASQLTRENARRDARTAATTYDWKQPATVLGEVFSG